ncbi:MAG: cupin [Chloroflexi bacterium]|nr:cupin [Chloroflexota bacterium]
MPVSTLAPVRITRWRGGQHPTLDKISRQLEHEGLRPYTWTCTPNFRHAACSHGYDKTLYCVQGAIEIEFPQTNARVTLHAGDRIDLLGGVRYSMIIGPSGAQGVEAARR